MASTATSITWVQTAACRKAWYNLKGCLALHKACNCVVAACSLLLMRRPAMSPCLKRHTLNARCTICAAALHLSKLALPWPASRTSWIGHSGHSKFVQAQEGLIAPVEYYRPPPIYIYQQDHTQGRSHLSTNQRLQTGVYHHSNNCLCHTPRCVWV